MLKALIEGLHEFGWSPQPEEILDLLWLAEQLEITETVRSELDSPSQPITPGPLGSTEKRSTSTDIEKTIKSPTLGESRVSVVQTGQIVVKPRPVSDTVLPHKLGLVRSLWPIRRYIPKTESSRVDETQTAEKFANAIVDNHNDWTPVFINERTRWFDLILLIDGTPNMSFWDHTLRELQRLLRGQGIFRRYRSYYLAALQPEHTRLRIFPTIPDTSGHYSEGFGAEDLIIKQDKTLIWIVSDCSGAVWKNGQVLSLIDKLGKRCPLTILQLLPQSLWHLSALPDAAKQVWIKTSARNEPNAHFQVIDSKGERIDIGNKNKPMSFPIITLNQRSWLPWAKAAAGILHEKLPGFIFSDSVSMQRSLLSAQDRVNIFLSYASAPAVKLASYLAMFKDSEFELYDAEFMLNEVLYFAKDQVLPHVYSQPKQGILAEVLLGPLVDNSRQHHKQSSYHFNDGVSEILGSGLIIEDLMRFAQYLLQREDPKGGVSLARLMITQQETGNMALTESQLELLQPVIKRLPNYGPRGKKILNAFRFAAEISSQRGSKLEIEDNNSRSLTRSPIIASSPPVLIFVDRIRELEKILSTKNDLLIDAPAGFGKTFLLEKAGQEMTLQGWKVIHLDLVGPDHKPVEWKQLAKRLLHALDATQARRTVDITIQDLIKACTSYNKILFVFDRLENVDPQTLTWIKADLMPSIRTVVRNTLRAIFSGRNIYYNAQPGAWNGYLTVKLAPLTTENIQRLLENLTPKPPEYWAAWIYWLSGGHPASIKAIINELHGYNWNFRLPLSQANLQDLFLRCVSQYVAQVKQSMRHTLHEGMDVLWIFRVLDPEIIQFLQTESLLQSSQTPLQILSDLSRGRLIKANQYFYSDATIQGLLSVSMEVMKPELFRDYHSKALEIFNRKLVSLFSNRTPPQSLVEAHLSEVIYHAVQIGPSEKELISHLASTLQQLPGNFSTRDQFIAALERDENIELNIQLQRTYKLTHLTLLDKVFAELEKQNMDGRFSGRSLPTGNENPSSVLVSSPGKTDTSVINVLLSISDVSEKDVSDAFLMMFPQLHQEITEYLRTNFFCRMRLSPNANNPTEIFGRIISCYPPAADVKNFGIVELLLPRLEQNPAVIRIPNTLVDHSYSPELFSLGIHAWLSIDEVNDFEGYEADFLEGGFSLSLHSSSELLERIPAMPEQDRYRTPLIYIIGSDWLSRLSPVASRVVSLNLLRLLTQNNRLIVNYVSHRSPNSLNQVLDLNPGISRDVFREATTVASTLALVKESCNVLLLRPLTDL
jgi:hypothetical protein